ncbi:MAG: hypothetical protein H8E66_07780 [Planctomycetes bacterium]|nr:hypothetical protein [Planctomycetota bacterium]
MNPSSDDSQMRDAVQRVRDADQRAAPAFDDVLNRAVSARTQRPARRLKVVAACCTVLAFAVVLTIRSRQNHPVGDPSPHIALDETPSIPTADARHEQLLHIDFDHMRRVIDEHYAASDQPASGQMSVWSSRTESLLAVNFQSDLSPE